jgi:hypothetical protein
VLVSAAALIGNAYPPFAVGLSATTVAGSSTSSTVESSPVRGLFTGGSGDVVWTWAYWDGDSAITPVSPGLAQTTFRATGMSVGTKTARFRGAARDQVTGETLVTDLVTVTLERGEPPLTGSVTNAHQAGNSSSVINVTAGANCSYSGGVAPITITWSDIAGFTKAPSGTTCYYGAALGPGETRTGSGTVTFRDANGQTAAYGFTVKCENTGTPAPPMTVTVNPGSVQGFSDGNIVTTEAVTVTVSGAVGGVAQVVWTRISGVGLPNWTGLLATFSYDAGSTNGTWTGGFQVAVQDGLGRWGYGAASAQFTSFIWQGPIN